MVNALDKLFELKAEKEPYQRHQSLKTTEPDTAF